MKEVDTELMCDYCHTKPGNLPGEWYKIDKTGKIVCPDCVLSHWDELKETLLADYVKVKYLGMHPSVWTNQGRVI
jgi:hypothetical protein